MPAKRSARHSADWPNCSSHTPHRPRTHRVPRRHHSRTTTLPTSRARVSLPLVSLPLKQPRLPARILRRARKRTGRISGSRPPSLCRSRLALSRELCRVELSREQTGVGYVLTFGTLPPDPQGGNTLHPLLRRLPVEVHERLGNPILNVLVVPRGRPQPLGRLGRSPDQV